MLDALTAALASPDGQPGTSFSALARHADALIGARLFTVLTFDQAAGEARRSYSNQPDAYPVAGTKPVPQNDWAERVLLRGETFVANDIEAIAAVFPDHALIRSLGCEACINVPIIVAGKTLGTLNILHEAGRYTPERVALSEGLKLPGAACLLLQRLTEKG